MDFTNKKKKISDLLSVKRPKNEALEGEEAKTRSEIEYVYGRALVPAIFAGSYDCFPGGDDYRNPPFEQ